MKQLLLCAGLLNYENDYDISQPDDKLNKLKCQNNINIQKISSGGYHILILDDKCKLYGQGSNRQGQLGYDPILYAEFNEIIEIPIDLEKDLHIVDIQASCRSSYLTLNNGSILSFGWNKNMQLGRETEENYDYIPRKIPNLTEYKCYFNGIFWWAIHLLTECGKVISFGHNEDGKLGLNSFKSIIQEPTINEFFNNKNVIRANTGSYHSIFLTKEGNVYTCGTNFWGQLGIPYVGDVRLETTKVPLLVESLNHEIIVDIHNGSNMNVCLTKNNKVYVFGNNSSNKLGLSKETHKIHTPTLLRDNISKVRLGGNFMFLFHKNKKISSCGWNKFFQLYHKDNKEDLQEIKDINYTINDIVCGAFFTIFVNGNYGHNKYFISNLDNEIECNLNIYKKMYKKDTLIIH